MASEGTTGKRRRTVTIVQQGLVPGRPAGAYQEPDHSIGEAAWPGKQPATRQLSLFDATFQKPLSAEEKRRIDMTPSPTQTRVVQRRLTSFSGFVSFSPSNSITDDPSSNDDASASEPS